MAKGNAIRTRFAGGRLTSIGGAHGARRLGGTASMVCSQIDPELGAHGVRRSPPPDFRTPIRTNYTLKGPGRFPRVGPVGLAPDDRRNRRGSIQEKPRADWNLGEGLPPLDLWFVRDWMVSPTARTRSRSEGLQNPGTQAARPELIVAHR